MTTDSGSWSGETESAQIEFTWLGPDPIGSRVRRRSRIRVHVRGVSSGPEATWYGSVVESGSGGIVGFFRGESGDSGDVGCKKRLSDRKRTRVEVRDDSYFRI